MNLRISTAKFLRLESWSRRVTRLGLHGVRIGFCVELRSLVLKLESKSESRCVKHGKIKVK